MGSSINYLYKTLLHKKFTNNLKLNGKKSIYNFESKKIIFVATFYFFKTYSLYFIPIFSIKIFLTIKNAFNMKNYRFKLKLIEI